MKSTTQVQRHYSLLIGTAMCGVGIIIFLNFSMQDFLTPGFIEKGIILENVEMQGGSSHDGIMHVDEIDKQYVIILSDNDSPTRFDVTIVGSQGEVLHNAIFEQGEIRFTPDVKDDYQVHVKNQSGKPASVSIIYGVSHNYNQTSLIMTALWVLLVIGGNYLILHKHFTKVNN
ncbi:MAG: hypothetical protein ACYC6W_07370 [Nitrosotalea sp.]